MSNSIVAKSNKPDGVAVEGRGDEGGGRTRGTIVEREDEMEVRGQLWKHEKVALQPTVFRPVLGENFFCCCSCGTHHDRSTV